MRTHEMDASTDGVVISSTTWGSETDRTPTYAVTSAVADASDRDVLELPPLNDAVDPDALNALFASLSNAPVDRVSFRYAGYDVVVRGSGDVHVKPAADE